MINGNPTFTETSPGPIFSLGRIVATPAALTVMTTHGVDPMDLLRRHQCGDWGNLHPDDAAENIFALTSGARLLSSYALKSSQMGGADAPVIWVITGPSRALTTLLTPEDY